MNRNDSVSETGAIGVGGLAALGHFAHMVEPVLADLSYLAAIAVGALTVYYKLRHKGKDDPR